jgi:NitT/TauT family transport system ATP-binding protein
MTTHTRSIAGLKKKPFRPGKIGTHITIRELTKWYSGKPLYEDFELDIPKNKVTCIFGPNGSRPSST